MQTVPKLYKKWHIQRKAEKIRHKCFFFEIQAPHQCPMKRVINGVTRLYTRGCQRVRTIDHDDEDDDDDDDDDADDDAEVEAGDADALMLRTMPPLPPRQC